MISTDPQVLKKRIAGFLTNPSPYRNGLLLFISEGKKLNVTGFMFGGAVRDIVLNGPSVFPRDVDIVLSDDSFPIFQRRFYDFIQYRNRFGGLYLRAGFVDFDAWPLGSTWAFKHASAVEPQFENLPRTTFLSIDAITVELWPKRGHARRIYDYGFFRSIETRTIDLNFVPNPFPALCILRTLVLSRRLQFRLTDRLAEYIVQKFPVIGIDGLLEANAKHYERPMISFELLADLFSRRFEGGAHFNRYWSEANAGFRRQSTFEEIPEWEVRERHESGAQLGFPGIMG